MRRSRTAVAFPLRHRLPLTAILCGGQLDRREVTARTAVCWLRKLLAIDASWEIVMSETTSMLEDRTPGPKIVEATVVGPRRQNWLWKVSVLVAVASTAILAVCAVLLILQLAALNSRVDSIRNQTLRIGDNISNLRSPDLSLVEKQLRSIESDLSFLRSIDYDLSTIADCQSAIVRGRDFCR